MRLVFVLAVTLCLTQDVLPSGRTGVNYEVSLARRAEQYLDVQMEISGLDSGEVDLAIPAWNNLYRIRNFGRLVRELSVKAPGDSTPSVRRVDKQTWSVSGIPPGSIVVSYSVFAGEPGSFSAEVDEHHAFIHPALVLLYLPARRDLPHRVKFSDVPEDWRIATGLEFEAGSYRASSYDHLIDSPFELGQFQYTNFEHGDTLYEIALDDPISCAELDGLREMARTIVRHQVNLMGKPTFRRYLFIYHVTDEGSGGMEHRNSTAIGLACGALGMTAASRVTAHEFFHLWNVKRIRPREFDCPDLQSEVYTRALWFSEGTTSYYALLTLVRTGLMGKEEFYTALAKEIVELYSRPARLIQSAEEASLLAWFEGDSFYRRPENSISYYNKGALISLLLDLEIRTRTENRRSLDDVLRFLNVRFGGRVGYAEGDIQRAAETVSQSDLSGFFERYVSGVEELPLEEGVELAGLEIYEEVAEELAPGFAAQRSREGIYRVSEVSPDSPASRSGLRVGDELASVMGVSTEDFRWSELSSPRPDDRIKVEVRREGRPVELAFFPKMTSRVVFELREKAVAEPLQEKIRKGLLSGLPDRVTSGKQVGDTPREEKEP